jgi:hypothetical protein
MRKTIMAWSACAAALLPALAATTASADGLPSGVGQLATSEQTAGSTGTSTQTGASNQAINVAILSPGAAAGAVTQANNSGASSNAGNSNVTNQAAPQSGGGGGVQGVGQQAGNEQTASSTATSTQTNPSNQAINVSILSPGSGGSGAVNQSNNSHATSNAGNGNTTTQTAPQSGGGGGGGVSGVGQLADNQQTAGSTATSTQDHPSNTAVNLSILSGAKGHEEKKVAVPLVVGGGGAVTQSNNSSATSNAGNSNSTTQYAPQSGGGAVLKNERCASCSPGGYPGVQGVGQLATNEQSAGSTATSTQYSPSNTAADLPILSPYSGGGGAVNQANNSSAFSNAGNGNTTNQFAPQSGGGRPGIQAVGQEAHNRQNAWSAATSTQFCPVNVAAGPFGAVTQANTSYASSNAGNGNTTNQNAPQAGWWPLAF